MKKSILVIISVLLCSCSAPLIVDKGKASEYNKVVMIQHGEECIPVLLEYIEDYYVMIKVGAVDKAIWVSEDTYRNSIVGTSYVRQSTDRKEQRYIVHGL